jgi:hypothetical protein
LKALLTLSEKIPSVLTPAPPAEYNPPPPSSSTYYDSELSSSTEYHDIYKKYIIFE